MSVPAATSEPPPRSSPPPPAPRCCKCSLECVCAHTLPRLGCQKGRQHITWSAIANENLRPVLFPPKLREGGLRKLRLERAWKVRPTHGHFLDRVNPQHLGLRVPGVEGGPRKGQTQMLVTLGQRYTWIRPRAGMDLKFKTGKGRGWAFRHSCSFDLKENSAWHQKNWGRWQSGFGREPGVRSRKQRAAPPRPRSQRFRRVQPAGQGRPRACAVGLWLPENLPCSWALGGVVLQVGAICIDCSGMGSECPFSGEL